jgi:putative glutamine amidotransferase
MLKIAITSRYIHDKQYFFFNNTYYQFLSSYFIIEYVLPRYNHDYHDIIQRNDALLIIGGDDIDAYYFHQKLHPQAQLEVSFIETMDFALVQQFYHAHKKIIGICRGIQVINVFFKGDLYQDIASQPINHRKNHQIHIQQNTFLAKYFPCHITVNSYHHQSLKNVSPLFQINALSDDGVIEGIENEHVLAVQWHPERMNKQHQDIFIQMIIDFISDKYHSTTQDDLDTI